MCGFSAVTSISELARCSAIETIEEALTGPWAGPLSNGAAGPKPKFFNNIPVCQAFDGRDGRWHPGKLHSTSCRYEYGGSIRYQTQDYYVLQVSPSLAYSFANHSGSGYTPSNAMTGSGSAALPICAPLNPEHPVSSGKVWGE